MKIFLLREQKIFWAKLKINTRNTVQNQAILPQYAVFILDCTLRTKCRNEKNFVRKHTVWILCFVAENRVMLIFELSRDNYLSKLVNVEHLQCISTVVLLQQKLYLCGGCCPHTGDLRIIHDRADILHHSLQDTILFFGDIFRISLRLRIWKKFRLIIGITNELCN
jgi:hypothetical protein